MSDLLQGGSFSQGAGATASRATLLNPPQWRYLWLQADVGNQAPLNVWIGTPPANRSPDFQLAPGQQREEDMGSLSSWSLWVQSADLAAWNAVYALDVESIGIDANTVGATTPLQPARTIAQFQTTNAVQVTTAPVVIPAGQQSVMIAYPSNSTGPNTLFCEGVQSGRIFACLAMPGSLTGVAQFLFLIPAGGADTSFTITHSEGDAAGARTVFVDALFVPLVQNVIASQGIGPQADGSWLVTVEGAVNVAAPLAVSQSGAWSVGQSGAWNVGQSGAPWSIVQQAAAGAGLATKAITVTGLASGASSTIVAGVAGKTIRVYRHALGVAQPGAAGEYELFLESTGGVPVGEVYLNAAAGQNVSAPQEQVSLSVPIILPSGDGLRVRRDSTLSASTCTALGTVAYQQA